MGKREINISVGGTYVTRGGEKVRIYATDGGGKFPIHGAIWRSQCWWPEKWDAEGRYIWDGLSLDDITSDNPRDLVETPPPPEPKLVSYKTPGGAYVLVDREFVPPEDWVLDG